VKPQRADAVAPRKRFTNFFGKADGAKKPSSSGERNARYFLRANVIEALGSPQSAMKIARHRESFQKQSKHNTCDEERMLDARYAIDQVIATQIIKTKNASVTLPQH
jgi:phosphopentomutase